VRLGLPVFDFGIVNVLAAFVLLLFILKIHERVGLLEILISFFSSIFIAVSTVMFWNFNIFVVPAVASLAFYLVISLWNIRFAGKIHLSDYLVPFLYVILALTLILNL
jgi:hypothetical protein